MAAPSARGTERAPLPVFELDERRIAARRDQRRIMEFVAAHDATRIADRAFGKHACRAIAEMELPLRKARGVAEQSRHRVPNAIRIFEALPEHHVAAALPVHGTRRGEARESLAELRGSGEPSGMKLGIAARKPAAIAIIRWRLIGEWREGNDLRAGAPPAVEHMRVDEAEGLVLRERDA